MAATYPGGSNTFIPSTEATNNLVVDFSRNPSEFALNQWTKYTPVDKNVFRWVEMTVEMAGRVLNTNGSDMAWGDGAEAPLGQGNTESFEFKTEQTKRYVSPYALGELAEEQAQWDILAQHGRIHAQRSMTLIEVLAINVAQTVANWPSANTGVVTGLDGGAITGAWNASTTARKDIKRSFDYAADIIRQGTLGAVKPSELMVVMSPGCARQISVTQEIVDHIKGSPAAKEELVKGLGPNTQYGLPSTLYGYPIVIDDTVRVTSRKGATKATAYAMDDAKPFMCSKVGELDGIEGSPDFSTFQTFWKEEMTVESKHDRDSRRHLGRVVNDVKTVLTASASGFLFQGAIV